MTDFISGDVTIEFNPLGEDRLLAALAAVSRGMERTVQGVRTLGTGAARLGERVTLMAQSLRAGANSALHLGREALQAASSILKFTKAGAEASTVENAFNQTGLSIERLRGSLLGTVDDTTIQKIGILGSEFGLAGEQMALVSKISLGLGAQGKDTTKSMEKLTRAIGRGSKEGIKTLERMGIVLIGAGGPLEQYKDTWDDLSLTVRQGLLSGALLEQAGGLFDAGSIDNQTTSIANLEAQWGNLISTAQVFVSTSLIGSGVIDTMKAALKDAAAWFEKNKEKINELVSEGLNELVTTVTMVTKALVDVSPFLIKVAQDVDRLGALLPVTLEDLRNVSFVISDFASLFSDSSEGIDKTTSSLEDLSDNAMVNFLLNMQKSKDEADAHAATLKLNERAAIELTAATAGLTASIVGLAQETVKANEAAAEALQDEGRLALQAAKAAGDRVDRQKKADAAEAKRAAAKRAREAAALKKANAKAIADLGVFAQRAQMAVEVFGIRGLATDAIFSLSGREERIEAFTSFVTTSVVDIAKAAKEALPDGLFGFGGLFEIIGGEGFGETDNPIAQAGNAFSAAVNQMRADYSEFAAGILDEADPVAMAFQTVELGAANLGFAIAHLSEVDLGTMKGAGAIVSSASNVIGNALLQTTDDIKAQAGIKAAMEVAESFAAFAYGNIFGGVMHAAAAVKFGLVAGGVISVPPPKAKKKKEDRAAAAPRRRASSQISSDRGGRGGGTQRITNVQVFQFGDGGTGRALVDAMNAEAARNTGAQLASDIIPRHEVLMGA